MGAHQHRLGRGDVALDQCHVLNPEGLVGENPHVPFAAEFRCDHARVGLVHKVVVAAAIGDQVADGADLQPVLGGIVHQIGQPRHFAVGLHDLANDRGRVMPRQPRHVTAGFGMTGADQHAAGAGAQRKHVPRRGNVRLSRLRVDRGGDGQCAVGGGNAGAHALARLDADGKRCLVARRIVHRHHRQAQLLDPLGWQRQTDQPAPVRRHKVDRGRIGKPCGNHQVAFVLAVFVVDQDKHLFDGADCARKAAFDGAGGFVGAAVGHRDLV